MEAGRGSGGGSPWVQLYLEDQLRQWGCGSKARSKLRECHFFDEGLIRELHGTTSRVDGCMYPVTSVR